MAKDFKVKNGEQVRTVKCGIASATVIEAGDIVTLSSGLIVKAGATSATIAYAPDGSADGETSIDVTVGNDFTLIGTADAAYAITDQGVECDIAGTTTLLIDKGENTYKVFKIAIGEDAGTVDSTENVEVKINKPLF